MAESEWKRTVGMADMRKGEVTSAKEMDKQVWKWQEELETESGNAEMSVSR